jgi:AcrR family transcriptional regulator
MNMPAARIRAKRKPVVRRPGGRSARVRQAVFDATLNLLASKGYQTVSIEGVAEAAGVNKTTIYRNWPTKAKLIQAAAADRSANSIATRSTGNLERDLTRLLDSVASYIASPIGRSLVIAALSESHDREVRQVQEKFWNVRFEAVRNLIQRDLGDAVMEKSAADELIEYLVGPLFLRAFITGRTIDSAFIRRIVFKTLMVAGMAGDRFPADNV